jgi:formate hydrogenlyase subunit 6/NADH:ubiquinone oxidoreductase subunit I
MIGILKALRATLETSARKPVTREYPDDVRSLPARNRGFPLLVWDHDHDEPVCIGCRQCDEICPVRCITVIGPVNNPRFAEKGHDVEVCKAEHDGVCIHDSPRKTLPKYFLIDEDRCMRCTLCEVVCPTDQERYGYQKAIVVGTGHLAIQAAVYDRNDNVLDLDALTYHSRVLNIELNAHTERPKDGLFINSPEARGMRLHAQYPIPFSTRVRAGLLKLYAPFWLFRRGLPRAGKPQPPSNGALGRSSGDVDTSEGDS